jgi:uroporphyrinogen-III decarboxylase
VPRTEYSAERHWELIQAVTGIAVTPQSSPEDQQAASIAFQKAWNYSFFWCTLLYRGVFGSLRTDMGHAEYAAGGVDRRDTIFCPFKTPEEVLALDPASAYGLRDPLEPFGPAGHETVVKAFEKHYQDTCRVRPFGVNMTGIYITLISGLIEIFGWDMMLLAAGTDQKAFGELMNRYAAWVQPYFNALADADVPVVMIHDDMVWTSGAFLRPDWYRQYLFPNLKKLLAPLREAGKVIAFTSDGNYTEFIDDIADAGVSGFVMEPTTDMAYIAEKYGRTHFFIGNADTRILLLGTKAQIRAEVERCMAIGKNCPGFFLAVGNHIPSNTPIENCLYYNEVYEELAKR